MQTTADLVDRSPGGPVLVYGSLPPDGRDLDLLVRADDAPALGEVLAAAGYQRYGRVWLPADRATTAVDLRTTDAWHLPADEVEALFAQAGPVPGFVRLVQPAPGHVLLLLARRAAAAAGGLDERRRARLDAALARDPAAWEHASRHAPAWGASAALVLLRESTDGVPAGRPRRAAALAERHAHEGDRRPVALARAWRGVLRRPPRGAVVAVCGLDGAGKSSQAGALAAALEQLGRPAVTQWTRLSYDPALDALARPVKKVVRRLRRRPPPRPVDVDASRAATPEQRIRQGSPLMTAVWAGVVAVSNGLAQRRSTRGHLRAGRVVVCDRWTLDSGVHLRYRYGESRRFGPQVAVIRLLSPRPVVTFFLDVPATTAYARKDDHYDAAQLGRQERLYGEEHRRHAAVRLDGTRPPAELSAHILTATLAALERRRPRA